MDLTDEEVQGFIDAWKKDFGEDLTVDKARTEVGRLLMFFALLGEELHPMPGPRSKWMRKRLADGTDRPS